MVINLPRSGLNSIVCISMCHAYVSNNYVFALLIILGSSRIDTKPLPETFYRHGVLDVINVVFYALIWIAVHALVQEYIWEVSGTLYYYCALVNLTLVQLTTCESVWIDNCDICTCTSL